ncbi:MAG: hypothetical protein HKN68_16510 [Saprospiraceae bacterium]|nr:hypothetical protein [Saprospiraceae bacterium]
MLFCSVVAGYAQVILQVQDTIPERDDRLIIENSGSRIVESSDTGRIQYLYEDVRAYTDSTYFYADTAVLTDSYLIAYGNMVIIQKDTIKLFGDSLYYNRDSSIAEVYGDVILENGAQRLSGNSLFYRVEDKIATYSDTAILEQGSMKLQSVAGKFLINEKIGYFDRDVILIDGDTRLRTNSMVYYTEEQKAEFISATRIKTIDAEIYCEEGYYEIESKSGLFRKNAQYKGEDRSVTGDEIYYEKEIDEIRVIGNTVFTSIDADGIADEMEYSEQTGDLVLIGQAVLQDSTTTIGGERITFNQDSKDLFIAGNGFLWKEDWSLNATNIEYNDISGMGLADGDVIYVDSISQSYLYCDEAEFDNSIQSMKAFNYDSRPFMRLISEQDTTVISSDTIQSYQVVDTTLIPVDTIFFKDTLHSDIAVSDSTLTVNNIDSVLVSIDSSLSKTLKDTLQSVVETSDSTLTVNNIDSALVTIDSSMSKTLTDTLQTVVETSDSTSTLENMDSIMETNETIVSKVVYDTIFNERKFLIADKRVGIYSKDMQALCDSFTFDMADSTFILIGGPVMWSDSTQFSGDTIYLMQKDDKLDRMIIQNNVMIINSIEPFFNQIKGKRLVGFFLEEEIDRFIVTGSAQSVYYMSDEEGAFIGVNTTDCSELKFNFESNEMSDIRGYIDVKSRLIPIDKADHNSLLLDGFKWKIDLKPKSEDDVINMN